MIEDGQFRITDDGHALLFGEFVVLTPAGVYLEIFEVLKKELGEKKTWQVIQSLGEFQMNAAIARYKERFNLEDAQSAKILDFMMEILNILGWGSGILEVDAKNKVAKITMRNSMLPKKYMAFYGKKSGGPIDYFVLGWMKALFKAYFGAEVDAKETLCAAKGDQCCEFVVKVNAKKSARKK
jgi:predicted hydrocarbon binding protein